MLTKEKLKELKQKSNTLDPIVRVGRNGLTDSVVDQIRKALVKRKLVKVKLLKAFTEENDRKESAIKLAADTGSELVSITGGSVVLFK